MKHFVMPTQGIEGHPISALGGGFRRKLKAQSNRENKNKKGGAKRKSNRNVHIV
jgi:hypothetical protein